MFFKKIQIYVSNKTASTKYYDIFLAWYSIIFFTQFFW